MKTIDMDDCPNCSNPDGALPASCPTCRGTGLVPVDSCVRCGVRIGDDEGDMCGQCWKEDYGRSRYLDE